MSASAIAPLFTWDPNLRDGAFWRHRDEASKWAIEHLPDAGATLLAEFYLIDAPFAVVHMVKRDENGRKCSDPEAAPIMQDPVTVTLDELPPERLWR